METLGFFHLFFDPGIALRYLPQLLAGAWVTLSLSVAIIVSGLLLGLALALLRLVAHRVVVALLRLLIDALRAVPPLAVILLLFFGLPSLNLVLSAYGVIWLTLTLILAAFAEEIFWAGISAIPRGQWEVARSTGLTQTQTLTAVVLPQAVRLCVPPLTNRAIAITKNTALGSVVGMPELLNEAQTALSFSGNATPLIVATVGYLLIFMQLMALAGYLEKRMHWGRRR